jgi:TRAP-type C4-dicarboxylate transport system permease large subunit
VATAATIGSVALPAFRQRGYDERFVLGSLAGGGALGNLIPPGIAFIVYLIWFGVIAVMLTEAALISPPEGLNLYVIPASGPGAMRARPDARSGTSMWASRPSS